MATGKLRRCSKTDWISREFAGERKDMHLIMGMDRSVRKVCKICKKRAEVERIAEQNVHYVNGYGQECWEYVQELGGSREY
jgi:hypothetical protein